MTVHIPGQQDESDEMLYGFFHLDDPRDFFPDDECCSPEEIASHREACLKAERGESWQGVPETHGPWVHADGRVVIGERPDGDDWTGTCHANRSFGIGAYLIHDEDSRP